MVFVSLRVQRVTAYLLVIVCVVLVYKFYSHDRFHREKRTSGLEPTEKDGSEALTRQRFTDLLRESHENVSKTKQHQDLLLKEINALKLKLSNSLSENRKLRSNIELMKQKEENMKYHISKLKSQNFELMKDKEKINISYHHQIAMKQEVKPYKRLLIAENIPFISFAKTHIYEPDSQPKPKEYMFRGQHRETRIIKPVRKHIFQIEDKIINTINANRSLDITREEVLDGVYRFDINGGVDYEYYFKDPSDHKSVIPVRASRYLSEPHIEIQSNQRKRLDETINLVLPLSGRLERFQNFIELFINVCIKKDNNVYLTVVLYGEKDFKFVKKILQGLEKDYGFRKYELVMRDKEFSRGRALHDGVVYWKGKDPNVLMFFCDVDITFSSEFLRRCRSYSQPGRQVYYPIVFSLYNPKNVYEDRSVPEPELQLKIGMYHIYKQQSPSFYTLAILVAGLFTQVLVEEIPSFCGFNSRSNSF